MRFKEAILIGLFTSLAVIVCLIQVMPSQEDFSLDNPFWNGLSWLTDYGETEQLSDYSILNEGGVNRRGILLLIIGPEIGFSSTEAAAVREFVDAGGLVVLADDFGSGNTLLQELRVEAGFNGMLVKDPLFKDRDSQLVKAVDFEPSPYTANLTFLQLNYATFIEVSGEYNGLGYTTSYSFIDVDGDGEPGERDRYGPFLVAAELEHGEGSLILFSDSSLFINSMKDKGSNHQFFLNLVRDRQVMVDTSHWETSNLSKVRITVYRAIDFLKGGEMILILVALTYFMVFKVKIKSTLKGKRMREDDEVEEALRLNPNWDRETLHSLKELRERVED